MAKKQMWLGSVWASCGSAQPLLLALMDNGGSPRKKGNAYTVLCCQAFARAMEGTFGWRGGLANMCGCILRGPPAWVCQLVAKPNATQQVYI